MAQRADWPAAPPISARSGSTSISPRPARSAGCSGRIGGSAATLSIKIVDYPGEWLLDLPLLVAELRRVVAHDAAALPQRRARRGRARLSRRSSREHRHDDNRERGNRAKQAHDLYCAFLLQGARSSWAELLCSPAASSAAAVLATCRISGLRRSTSPKRGRAGAQHARRADGGALRSVQARGGRRVFTKITFAAIRARSCWSTCCARCSPAAKRSRIRGGARGDPAELPLWRRRPALEALAGAAYRQGAVRRHQGRPRARHPARSSRRTIAQHGGVPGDRGARAATRRST